MAVQLIRLSDKRGEIIDCLEMEDGQLALITKWAGGEQYIGEVVQRVGRQLICIGKGEGNSWSIFFERPERIEKERNKHMVEILPDDGVGLLITKNEFEELVEVRFFYEGNLISNKYNSVPPHRGDTVMIDDDRYDIDSREFIYSPVGPDYVSVYLINRR